MTDDMFGYDGLRVWRELTGTARRPKVFQVKAGEMTSVSLTCSNLGEKEK